MSEIETLAAAVREARSERCALGEVVSEARTRFSCAEFKEMKAREAFAKAVDALLLGPTIR